MVPEKDPDALADCFYNIFLNYDYYLQETNLSQKMAAEFDWSIVCQDLITYLESIK